MFKHARFLLSFCLALVGSLIFISQVQAQSCNGGQVQCGLSIVNVCNPTGCQQGIDDPCSCSSQCGGGTVSAACSGYGGTPGNCSATAICQLYNGVCLKSGSCTYQPPPPTCSNIGQQYCGGCINGCRPLSQSCAIWIQQQCTDGGPQPTPPPGGWGGCASCENCGRPNNSECVQDPNGACLWDPGSCSNPPPPPPPMFCNASVGSGGAYPFVDIPSSLTPGQAGQVWGMYTSTLGFHKIENSMNPPGGQGTPSTPTYHKLNMYSSNPGIVSVSEDHAQPWHSVFGPLFNWSAVSGGTATINYYVYGKLCPACGFTPACQASRVVTVTPVCTPSCAGNQCGQSDGCGGTCPATDAGVPPAAPTNLNPVNSSNVSPAGNTVTISWSSPSALTDVYEVQVGNATNPTCGTLGSYCSSNVTGTSINFTTTNGIYVYAYRVRAVNNSCGIQPGAWSPWTYFGITGNITGNFRLDPNRTAVVSGGVCINGSGGATNIGTGGSLTSVGIDGLTRNATITNSTYSLFTYKWSPGNNTMTLVPGVAPNGEVFTCSCPVGCTYSGISSPQANVNFFLVQNDAINGGWWQALGGSVYGAQASGVTLRSYIPTFYCTLPSCKPYFIGQNTVNGNDTAGVAVTGGGAVDSTKDAGNQGTNVTQRGTQTVATGVTTTRIKENYDYFYREFSLGVNPSDDFASSANDASKPTSAPANGKQAYYHNGNLTVQRQWSVGANEKIVVFVNGDLTITDPSSVGQLISVAQGGFLSFIVKGNINVTPSVGNSVLTSLTPNIAGVFIGDGTVTFQGAGAAAGGDKRLVAEGTYVGWTNIVMQRDFDDGGARKAENNTKAAGTFIFRPDFVRNLPEAMTRSSYIWQETN